MHRQSGASNEVRNCLTFLTEKNMATESGSSAERKMAIGLIVNSSISSKYLYELSKWGQLQDNLLITHLIIQNTPNTHNSTINKAFSYFKKNGFLHTLGKLFFVLITKFEHLVLLQSKRHKDHLTQFNLKDFVVSSIVITPIISKSGRVHQYSDPDIRNVRDLKLDVLIWCGSGVLRGEILSASRFGILSIQYGDNRVHRGGPAGFWEVYQKEGSTGFTIHQLTEELDGGIVLFRGCFPTRMLYLLNQASLFEKSNSYLKKVLSGIAVSRRLPRTLDSLPYFNPLLKTPNLIEQLCYFSYFTFAVAMRFIDTFLLKRKYRWGVAFVKNDWKSLVMWRGTKIRNPPNHFLADPFVIGAGNESYCFVEDYDYEAARGCISVYKLSDNNSESLGDAIVEPFHMSFPYIFRFGSEIFMCPETSENRDIRLYECVNFPLKWKLKVVLMSDVSATDTMIFQRDGVWWLFTNIDSIGSGDYSELSIFYSDSPLSEAWHPHPKNPIFVDSMKARNAGLLFDENSIFRVSQRQGFEMYGKGSSINKILILNKNDYVESTLISIEPNFYNKILGTHHLHSNGEFSVFDYVELAQVRS